MNYYPFHIGDFRSGTVNMSRQSRWIYRDMLDVYYDTEAPLSLDLDVLCDAIGVEADDERKMVERLLRFKFEKTESGYRHGICEAVITDYHQKAETAKANGKLGGRPKKNTKEPQEKPSGFLSGSDQVPLAIPTITGSEANQEPRTTNQEPVTTSPIGDGGTSEESDGADNCPQQRIIEAYHRLLPSGRQVREWTPARGKALRTRWREKAQRQKIEWWERFFAYVAASDFLTGKASTPGRKPFEVSLDWLVKAENMAKVIEGAYENEKVAA